eukprot:scaffold72483_cov66-Phaeocystis_antarctica.AAC.2
MVGFVERLASRPAVLQSREANKGQRVVRRSASPRPSARYGTLCTRGVRVRRSNTSIDMRTSYTYGFTV